MQRITITIEDDLLAEVDALVARKGYASRSEAMRDLVRAGAAREAEPSAGSPCIATLSYVYDHGTRELAQRLTAAHHHRHDLTVASMHVHLDHDSCLEVSVLRGPSGSVREFADAVTSQRGVRHFRLHLIPAALEEERHDHGSGRRPHTHVHA
jgi:CopG family nickel-responsive transcriptional regulator